MRRVQQPGPMARERAVVVPAQADPLTVTLPAGVLLRDALSAAVADHGFDSAVFALEHISFAPFAYVMPARSPDGRTAAWYSDQFHPEGETQLQAGALTLGLRDGAPFYHAHGIWRESSGALSGGHLLPDICCTAQDTRLTGIGLRGARFETRADPETGFSLFVPVPTGQPPARTNALALRLCPNQDLVTALETLADQHALGRARVCGGVGSTIGVRWTDGTGGEMGFATELALTEGLIDPVQGSQVHAVLVDLHRQLGAGWLVAGDNPVLMTLEAVLYRAEPV